MEIDDLEFREFFAVQFGRLCWLGYLLTGDRGRAEELAQDTLVRTYIRWRVRRPADPAMYARRVLVNRHRSLARRALVELRHAHRVNGAPATVPRPGEDAVVVWAALSRLPVKQRVVLALRYHEDLSEAQVARMLGIPLGTVKTRARRGLERLRSELGSTADDFVQIAREEA
jgi:RNA polymerase sigma-70 factor (sigma-E family)